MKKYFITGLVILLPLALTLAIITFIFNFLTAPFVGIVRNVLGYFGLVESGFLFFSAEQLQIILSKLIIFVLLFSLTVFLGAIGRWFFVHYLFKAWDYIFHCIPFVSSIYKTCQDVIKTIFSSKTKSFKQVVLAPFPNAESHSIGLITKDHLEGLSQETMVAVFVPTTPNPTSGFLLFFKQKDLIYLDMSVEDAFKYVISCGVITSPFASISPDEAQKRIHIEEQLESGECNL
jgi:uncharacterized membrane protein